MRLRRFVNKLMRGEPVNIGAVGASISAGAGAIQAAGSDSQVPGYLVQFESWLRNAFPKSNATLHVRSAACSTTCTTR